MSTFGDNLRNLRKEKNMSQEQFATMLGTTKQVISRYENGQRSPKVSVVSDYAEKLGVTIAALTSNGLHEKLDPALGSDTPAAKKLQALGESLGASTPAERELMDLFRDLNQRGQEALLGTARGLASNPDYKKDGASNDRTA